MNEGKRYDMQRPMTTTTARIDDDNEGYALWRRVRCDMTKTFPFN